jgi:PPOX class probable F420-dependent enzyme
MKLTSHLPDDRRAHVEGRLRANLMAWLTTVRPDGRPDSVPVWFLLQDDETILVYSQAAKVKLRNIRHNPRVALGLDVTDLGRDIIRAVRPPGARLRLRETESAEATSRENTLGVFSQL